MPSDAGLLHIPTVRAAEWLLSTSYITASSRRSPGHWSLLGKIGDRYVRNTADGRLHGSKRHWRAYGVSAILSTIAAAVVILGESNHCEFSLGGLRKANTGFLTGSCPPARQPFAITTVLDNTNRPTGPASPLNPAPVTPDGHLGPCDPSKLGNPYHSKLIGAVLPRRSWCCCCLPPREYLQHLPVLPCRSSEYLTAS